MDAKAEAKTAGAASAGAWKPRRVAQAEAKGGAGGGAADDAKGTGSALAAVSTYFDSKRKELEAIGGSGTGFDVLFEDWIEAHATDFADLADGGASDGRGYDLRYTQLHAQYLEQFETTAAWCLEVEGFDQQQLFDEAAAAQAAGETGGASGWFLEAFHAAVDFDAFIGVMRASAERRLSREAKKD